MSGLADPAVRTAVLCCLVIAVFGVAGRRHPSGLLLAAIASLAVSPRHLRVAPVLDADTLDAMQKVALLAAVLWFARRRGIHPRELLPVAALVLVAALSFTLADLHPRLTGFQVLRSFLALAATWLFLAARRTSQDGDRQLAVLTLLPLLNVGLGLALWTVGLHDLVRHEYTGAWRLQGATIPAHLGMLTVVAVAAGMSRWARGRAGSSALVAASLVIAVLTGTRAAILLGFAVVVAMAAQRAALVSMSLRARPRRTTAYAAVVLAVVALYLPSMRARVFGNPLEAGFNTSGRVQAWQYFWAVAGEQPWFGRGLGASTVANNGALPAAFRLPHNEYLRLLVDGGWVGLAVYLAAATVALSSVLRRAGRDRPAVVVVIGAWAVYCLVDNALSTPQASFLFPTLLAALAAPGGPTTDGTLDERPRTRVVYIAGTSRSGSTLLEAALHRVPGVIAAGELTYLWSRGALGGERCGCGAPFTGCPFWTAVGRHVPGGWTPLTVRELVALQERVGRHRVMLLSLVGWQRRRQRRELDRYADALAQLYAAVAAESGARVVVDSSKLPVTAWVLARGGAVDLSVVHLVRDSRGYAWSTRKRVPRPESPGELMPRRGALHAGLEWLAFHVLAVALSRAHVPYQRVRYEALAADPDRVVADMAWLVGPAPTAVTTTTADGVVLDMASRHSVSGNPLRFRTGPVLVEPDDAWRRDLPRPHRWLVTLVTAPGLLYFRYPLRS